LLGGGFEPDLQAALTQMIRIIAPAILFFGLSGIVTGLLYALKRFTFPAFGAAVFNLGIIVTAPLLAGRLDAYGLAVGVLAGSILQLLIQTPGLRGAHIRFGLSLSDPALRRIFALYLPLALGLVVSNLQIMLDRRLASGTGESSIAWMSAATTLIQLPHGLVAVAISLAVLPTLSRFSAAGDEESFRGTLGQGLRLVLVLIIPATLGLLVLGRPLLMRLFEHGKFTSYDTYWVTWALRCYLVGLVFATIDWPLNYAFYARQNTLTPALVGIFSVAVYTAVALALVKPMGMLGLVLADSAKHISHALVMIVVTWRRMGGLAGMGLGQTALKSLAASLVMAGAMALVLVGILSLVTEMAGPGLVSELAAVVVTGAVGVAVYLVIVSLLRVEEIAVLRDLVRKRLRGSNLDS
jgi:putative peptidoglycan lipid II flippase